MNKWVYIAYACAWIATSIAVSVGIIISKSVYPLWAMFIPTFISFECKSK